MGELDDEHNFPLTSSSPQNGVRIGLRLEESLSWLDERLEMARNGFGERSSQAHSENRHAG